jgi:putative colanic acid biosynthesis acetyltransferase WcaF
MASAQRPLHVGELVSMLNIYRNQLSLPNKIGRVVWNFAWLLLYRPSPKFCFAWRRMLLRLFGAVVRDGAHPYPRCRIWAPWNLVMGEHSCLANDVDCYSVAPVKLGAHATVSQYAFLCTATHDYEDADFHLITKPIDIGDYAWVGARAFIAPGVVVDEGAVVGATASVYRDVPKWTVVGGNPAKVIKRRVIKGSEQPVEFSMSLT